MNESVLKALSLRRHEQIHILVQWKKEQDVKLEKSFADEFCSFLKTKFSKYDGDYFLPPNGIIFRESKRLQAQLYPGSFIGITQLDGNYASDWPLTIRYIDKHWREIISFLFALKKANRIALICRVKLSFEGFDNVKYRELVCRYLKPFEGFENLMDADFRVGFGIGERYVLNFGLSPYADYDISIERRSEEGQEGYVETTTQQIIDEGILLKIDANTRFQEVFCRVDVEFNMEDYFNLLNILSDAVVNRAESFLKEMSI